MQALSDIIKSGVSAFDVGGGDSDPLVTRITRAEIENLADNALIVSDRVYLITDEDRLAIGLASSVYQAFAKEGEGGGGGPTLDGIWIDLD